MRSIYLYPSLCYFEGTPVSLGRGTEAPFQLYGHPSFTGYQFTFTPESRPGAKNPTQLGNKCYGVDLRALDMGELQQLKRIDLSYLVDAYMRFPQKEEFFQRGGDFFDKLMGQTRIREMIKAGTSAIEIEATWKEDVKRFRQQRKKYLIYPE